MPIRRLLITTPNKDMVKTTSHNTFWPRPQFPSGGSRFSTSRAFLRPASYRENLHVALNALGSRVLVDPVDKKVTGVEFIQNGETKTVKVKREVRIPFDDLQKQVI